MIYIGAQHINTKINMFWINSVFILATLMKTEKNYRPNKYIANVDSIAAIVVSLILCNSENTFNTKIRINAEYVIVTKSKNVSPKNEKVNIIINEPIFIFKLG